MRWPWWQLQDCWNLRRCEVEQGATKAVKASENESFSELQFLCTSYVCLDYAMNKAADDCGLILLQAVCAAGVGGRKYSCYRQNVRGEFYDQTLFSDPVQLALQSYAVIESDADGTHFFCSRSCGSATQSRSPRMVKTSASHQSPPTQRLRLSSRL